MDCQAIIYERIRLYNEELEETKNILDENLRAMKKYLIETVLQELEFLLIEFQE